MDTKGKRKRRKNKCKNNGKNKGENKGNKSKKKTMEQQMEIRPVPGKQIRDGRLAKVRDAPSIELQYSFPQNGYAAMIATCRSETEAAHRGHRPHWAAIGQHCLLARAASEARAPRQIPNFGPSLPNSGLCGANYRNSLARARAEFRAWLPRVHALEVFLSDLPNMFRYICRTFRDSPKNAAK